MNVIVNGSPCEIAEFTLLLDFLNNWRGDWSNVIVLVNGSIIEKENYSSYLLTEHDVIELLSFVGGG